MSAPDGDRAGPFRVTPAGLEAVLEHVDEVVLGCDADGTVRFASESFRTMLGYAPSLFAGHNIVEIVHPDDLPGIIEELTRWAGRTGTPRGLPTTVRTADGDWVRIRYDAAIGQNFGSIGSLIVTLRLESSTGVAERELRARTLNMDRIVRISSAFLHLPTEDFDKGIDIAIDEVASLEDVTRVSVWRFVGNQVVRRAFWQAAAGAPSVPLADRIRMTEFVSLQRAAEGEDTYLNEPWTHGPEYAAERGMFLAAGSTAALISPMSAGGAFVGIVMVETTTISGFSAIHLDAVHSACAVLAEAFLRHDVEQRLAEQALTDRVTGLANRWAFDAELERGLSDLTAGQSQGLALAILDLDRFKVVNDTFGHAAGDQLLVDVARRLQHGAPRGTMLARLGGDELLVLVENVPTPDDSLRIVEDLVQCLAIPFDLPAGAISLTVSGGVAHTTDGSVGVGELMRLADIALYRMKGLGGDALALANPDTHRPRSHRLRRESELHEAVQHQKLSVHFQPEFDLRSGDLVGAEALVRWDHPIDGLLAAGEFVPLAEASGLIDAMGRQVLRMACEQAVPWCKRLGTRPFVLRVNVAARQLRNDDFVEQIEDTLVDTGLDPTALCLELTESTLLTDPAVAAVRFGALRALGIGLAVDDFGTGYSSYLQLRSLPLTALKIDQSFVSGLPDNATDGAIVAATLGLAAALDLTVTAEGVETEGQRDALIALGCPTAQGYLLGRPMTAEAFAALVESTVAATSGGEPAREAHP